MAPEFGNGKTNAALRHRAVVQGCAPYSAKNMFITNILAGIQKLGS